MKIKHGIILILALSVILASGCTDTKDRDEKLESGEPKTNEKEQKWKDTFNLEACDFSSTGKNTYFILEPGYQLTLGGYEDNNSVELVITTLNVTRTIDGVETRVVEERESVNGALKEISWNFFAFCKQTKDIYYFGEDVDIYDRGKVVSHDGAWKAGIGGARAGIIMLGTVKLGSKYYNEVAPGIAMDRAEILNDNETLKTPAGSFTNILKIEETTPLEPTAGYKLYAPDIGIIKDGELLLTRYGFIDLNNFTAYITQQYAKEIASEVANGAVTEIITEERDNRLVYMVRLIDDKKATNVKIDALTGAIVTIEKSDYKGNIANTSKKITEEYAKEIAIKAVPGSVTDIVQDSIDGKLVYVVEIINNNSVETDVIIDIVTGEIVRIET